MTKNKSYVSNIEELRRIVLLRRAESIQNKRYGDQIKKLIRNRHNGQKSRGRN